MTAPCARDCCRDGSERMPAQWAAGDRPLLGPKDGAGTGYGFDWHPNDPTPGCPQPFQPQPIITPGTPGAQRRARPSQPRSRPRSQTCCRRRCRLCLGRARNGHARAGDTATGRQCVPAITAPPAGYPTPGLAPPSGYSNPSSSPPATSGSPAATMPGSAPAGTYPALPVSPVVLLLRLAGRRRWQPVPAHPHRPAPPRHRRRPGRHRPARCRAIFHRVATTMTIATDRRVRVPEATGERPAEWRPCR